MEEIKSKVFEYIKVMARPMVLYQRDHPIHWSPVYIGGKVSFINIQYKQLDDPACKISFSKIYTTYTIF